MSPSDKDAPLRVIAQNRKARHEYHIMETFEAGLVLTGTEVKSLRAGKATVGDAYAQIDRDELFLHNLHISAYEQGNRNNHEPLRRRKLLVHAKELNKLIGKVREKGYSLIPLRLYFRGGWAKIEIGVGRGKKHYDKRHDLAKRDAQRDMERAMRRNR